MGYDVSVIVPMYNGEQYIEDTLKSIINQDFENFQIVVVNDGSTDNSLKIAETICKQSNIPYEIINQKNQGVSVARNVGIENAQGKYVIFVDDDDMIARDHISCLFKNAQHNDGSFTKMLKTNREGDVIQDENVYSPIKDKTSISSKDLIKLELTMSIPFSFCQIMYRKDLIKEKFNTDAVYGEDTEFALKNLIHMNTLGICQKPTYFYRQSEDSATRRADFKRFEFIRILEDLSIYYSKNNHKDLDYLIRSNRIPKAIFGNLMYFFHKNYDFNQTMLKMEELDLFNKLKNFEGDLKFKFKVKLFLFNPKLYYKAWKTFKDGIS